MLIRQLLTMQNLIGFFLWSFFNDSRIVILVNLHQLYLLPYLRNLFLEIQTYFDIALARWNSLKLVRTSDHNYWMIIDI